jgi:hypothetical protein
VNFLSRHLEFSSDTKKVCLMLCIHDYAPEVDSIHDLAKQRQAAHAQRHTPGWQAVMREYGIEKGQRDIFPRAETGHTDEPRRAADGGVAVDVA